MMFVQLPSGSVQEYKPSLTLTKSMVGLGNVQNTAFYSKSTTVNGTSYNMAGTSSGAAFTIYAPTSAGTSDYVLKSSGSGAPTWVAQSTLSVGSAAKLGSSNSGNTGRGIYLKSGSPTECTWSTFSSTTTGYYLIAATGASANLSYNTSIKVQSNAVYASGGFYESSDERLKNILNPIRVNLDELSKLRKVYYLWKDNSSSDVQLGVIAQDIQKLYPELVSTNSDTGYLSLSYDKLSVIALEAIDTLYKEHKLLKERVDKLEKLLTNKGIS